MSSVLAKVLFYAIPTLFIMFFALYTKWQIVDEDDGTSAWTEADTKWHRYGLFMRATFFVAMLGWLIPTAVQWVDSLLLMPIMMIEWDIAINVARGRGIWDVGTGGWDAKIGKKKWAIYFLFLLVAITIYITN